MGVLNELGIILQGTGNAMQGKNKDSEAYFQEYEQIKNLREFKNEIGKFGADPDNPLSWNEDVLALALKKNIIKPDEALNLGIRLAQQRRAAAAEKRQAKQFEWSEEDRKRAEEDLEKKQEILEKAPDDKTAIDMMFQAGLISPQDHIKYKQSTAKFKLDMARTKAQLAASYASAEKNRATTKYYEGQNRRSMEEDRIVKEAQKIKDPKKRVEFYLSNNLPDRASKLQRVLGQQQSNKLAEEKVRLASIKAKAGQYISPEYAQLPVGEALIATIQHTPPTSPNMQGLLELGKELGFEPVEGMGGAIYLRDPKTRSMYSFGEKIQPEKKGWFGS